LKQWLFGGGEIPVGHALFDVAQYQGAIVSDLFDEERYFGDAQAFWTLQNAAIAEKREAYLQAGWSEVVVLETGMHFAKWHHVKVAKKKGGKVFVSVTYDGEVAFHEGWLTEKEARKAEKAHAGQNAPEAKPERAELTKAMRNYLGLHRHAAVRTELLAHPGTALRLAAAHMIAGSSLWQVKADDQRPDNEAIGGSLAASKAQAAFADERAAVLALLGLDADDGHTLALRARPFRPGRCLADIFSRLMAMDEPDVLRVLALAMAETLEAHTGTVDTLGAQFSTDMRQWWTPDEAFFDLLRDKEAINAMVREVAGDNSAEAHKASTAKVQKQVIANCLNGTREAQVKDWMPRYMAFPASGYTIRFGGEVPAPPQE
jgi:ParB family chromosome partitioning protein